MLNFFLKGLFKNHKPTIKISNSYLTNRFDFYLYCFKQTLIDQEKNQFLILEHYLENLLNLIQTFNVSIYQKKDIIKKNSRVLKEIDKSVNLTKMFLIDLIKQQLKKIKDLHCLEKHSRHDDFQSFKTERQRSLDFIYQNYFTKTQKEIDTKIQQEIDQVCRKKAANIIFFYKMKRMEKTCRFLLEPFYYDLFYDIFLLSSIFISWYNVKKTLKDEFNIVFTIERSFFYSLFNLQNKLFNYLVHNNLITLSDLKLGTIYRKKDDLNNVNFIDSVNFVYVNSVNDLD